RHRDLPSFPTRRSSDLPQVDGDDRLLRPQGVPAGRRRGVAVRMSQPAPLDEFDPQEFPPTLREVMLRPRWIGMLLLCLVVAGIRSEEHTSELQSRENLV